MEQKITIGREFSFSAAHKLPDEPDYGNCARLHGHNYKLFVEVEGELSARGWVMNFQDLKVIVNSFVIDLLDHEYLNKLIPVPTAENILLWIRDRLQYALPNLKRLILYETEKNYAVLEVNRK